MEFMCMYFTFVFYFSKQAALCVVVDEAYIISTCYISTQFILRLF